MLCILTKGRLDSYSPPTQKSRNYKNWIAVLDLKTCLECRSRHGQIYQMDEIPDIEPPLHPSCRCKIKPMEAVIAGQGTKDGENGADFWIKYVASLPDYYITRDELLSLGWKKVNRPLNLRQGKWLLWEFIKIEMDIYLKDPGESGMRRTSTITVEDGTVTACYGRMMGCCLSPTIIMRRFGNHLKEVTCSGTRKDYYIRFNRL